MRFLSTLLFVLCISFTCSAQTSIAELQSEEYFDFWVGKWEVSWEEADGTMGRGSNFIEKTLDCTVIQEHFQVDEGQMEGYKGTSISVYNPRTNTWKQAWADNQGGYFDFTGKVEGDNRIFQTDIQEMGSDTLFTQRMVFYDITPDSLKWDWESSIDGGKTWALNWRINYRKLD
ncbi:hypothetical protein [Gracilimonas sp.]|uniref:hypothetical protein n=1 Tax=Gracilimonas sp. TaxID=1974203 RepID=UPI00287226DA|nr:hypothetical protein [Gracilimonas sp.]